MYPVNNPAQGLHARSSSLTGWTLIKLLLVCLVTASIPFALYVRVDSKASKAEAAVTVHAFGRGKPYFNFQNGRESRLDFRGEQHLTQALQANQAQPRALATTHLRHAAVPDLIAGYAYNGMGIVTVQYGNPEAFAPTDESIYARMQQGYNPEPMLPGVETYLVPTTPDFLQVGDFNHDNRKDVLIATRGGNLFLIPGDGLGKLNAAEQISVPGGITAMTAGEFRAADGWTDVAIGVETPAGPALLIYDGNPGLSGEPMSFQLSAPATSVQIASLDNDPYMDVAVAAGSEVNIIHGWGRKQEVSLDSRRERINLNSNARDLAAGFFIWNRAASNQIAVLSDDGNVNVLDQGGADSRPFTTEDLAQMRLSRRMGEKQATVDIEAVAGWQSNKAATWATARQFNAGSAAASAPLSQSILHRSHVSFFETDDLMVLNGSQNKVDFVRQIDSRFPAQFQSFSGQGDMATTSLDASQAPVALLALPQKVNGERNLVMLQQGSSAPTLVPQAPTATPVVDRFDDPVGGSLAGASVCGGGANDCSLRGAVQVANASPGSTITIPAGTVVLSSNGTAAGGCDGNTVGDLGVNQGTTINGAGAGSTIIRQSGVGPSNNGDRVMCMNETFLVGISYSFSGFTVHGGRDSGGFGGGGIIGGELNNVLTITGLTISNNQVTGGNLGGGGIQITGGNLTVTNCTIGGTLVPVLGDRTTITRGNINNTSTGGGLYFTPSAPQHSGGTGTLQVSGTTIDHNHAFGTGGGGATSETFAFAAPGGIGSGTATYNSTTFNANQASSGGGLLVSSLATTLGSVAGTISFTSNSATGNGGGTYVGGASLTIDGTLATINYAASNTATLAGTSVGTAAIVNVVGTQVTTGGSIASLGGGNWSNGSATLNPTNVDIQGGIFNCNTSTMNVAGNLTVGASGNGIIPGQFNGNSGTVNIAGNITTSNTAGTTFNAGTSTFNFNGSGAQSISGSLSPTFNNFIVNKTGGSTLTLGVNTPITGNLSVNQGNFNLVGFTANRTAAGGTLTVSNGAALRIGGTGTLPSNFTTHSIGATSTIEYNGTNQTVATLNSAQKYGNLILAGSGTKTLAGAISIATSLTINGTATLDASSSNFNIDNAGSWNNNVAAANFNPRAATVTFSSGAQTIGGTATSQTFNNIVMNNTSLTVGGSTTTLNINSNLTLTAGVFSPGTAANINIGGNWTNNIGPAGFVPGTGTVTFNSTTAAQAINGTAASQTFNNLTVSKTGQTLSFAGSTTQLDLNGNFNLTAGTVVAPATINANADWTVATGAIFTPGSGTVNFVGTGARNINGTATTQAFNNLVINKSGGGSVTNSGSATLLSITGGVTLTAGTFAPNAANVSLAGNWTNNGGVFTPGTSTVTFNSGAAGQAINGTAASQTFNNITVTKSAQSLTVGGSTTALTLNGNMNIASGNFNAGTAASINVAGNWTLDNTATFTPGGGTNTVTFNGTGAQSLNGTATSETFNNLTVNKTAGTLSVAGSLATLNIANDITITQGTLAGGTATINVAGNWSNAGTFTANTSTVVFNGNGNAQVVSGNTTFNNLTINHAGAGNVDASGSTLAVTGLLRVQQGTFISSSQFNNVQIDSGTTLQGSNGTTMSVSGNWTNNGGTFTPNGNTVNFNGAAAQTIGGTSTTQSFNNFTVNKGGGTLSVVASTTTLDIDGNVTLTAGTFAAGTATTINVAGNWTNNATFTPGAGTVVFDGANNTQTLAGTTSFNNLTINHTGTGNVTAAASTLTVTGLLRVQAGTFISASTFNNVQIDSGATLEGTNATTMNVSGNWTNNGGTFTPNGNTVNFNGAGAQAINGTAAAQTFNNFIVNKSAGALTAGGSTTSITTNDLTMTLGSFTAPATLDINGNTVLTAGTLTSGANITAAGNWTNNGGTFAGGAGTVTFDGGGGQTIGGTAATIFTNLTNSNLSGLAMANDNTVNGLLALTAADITVAATRTLTQPVGGTSSGTFDVNGRVQRTGFVTGGAALSFGNPLNTIQVTAGVAPANIVVDLTRSVPVGAQGFPTAVQRTYTITPSAAGFTGTLRLRYLESELNGNIEGPSFVFRRFNGTAWQPVIPTSSDFTANWLEVTGVTQFSPWTFNSTFTPTGSNGVVTGRILDNNGAPVEGAVVRLEGTQNRKFITDADGFYRFENVETNGFYTVTPSRANYTFSPANRSFTQVGESTNAAFGATVATSGLVNPLDTPEYFVRQHYLDFLGREPDESGFNFWSDQIIECGADQSCIGRRRENVSAAYFLSIEFRKTGGIVDSLYRVGLGSPADFAHFMPDMRAVGRDVIVGKEGWEAKLQANKEAFIAEFVNRPAFHAAYDGMTNSAFVDTLISHAGVSFTAGERDALVSGLNQGSMNRADALVAIAENERFVSARLNEQFVMMEYYGYLRRDPDSEGFAFWLNKLNQFGGNFEQAEMVKSFIVSGEYRDRFPK